MSCPFIHGAPTHAASRGSSDNQTPPEPALLTAENLNALASTSHTTMPPANIPYRAPMVEPDDVVENTGTDGSSSIHDEEDLLVRTVEELFADHAAANPHDALSAESTPAEATIPTRLQELDDNTGDPMQDNNILRMAAARKARVASLFQRYAGICHGGFLMGDIVTQKIVWVNEAGQRILGRLDLVGKPITTVLPPELREDHPSRVVVYQERYKKEYRLSNQVLESRIIDEPKPRRIQMARMENGREQLFWAELTLHSLRMPHEPIQNPPRLYCVEFTDCTTRWSESEELKILRACLSNVSDGIVVAHIDGKIEWMNKSMEMLSGYSLSSVLSSHSTVSLFVPVDFYRLHETYLQNFKQRVEANRSNPEFCIEHRVPVLDRRAAMRTAHGKTDVQLRVEMHYNRLVAFFKSTQEYVPREDFEVEQLKALLPPSIVRLIANERVKEITSQKWEFTQTTIMFVNFASFADLAGRLSASAAHTKMQPHFVECEEIVTSFGGELIQRFADGMLCIFGFNGERNHHSRLALGAAIEIQLHAIAESVPIRIGINSGKIGAGIYGLATGRPAFDAWGPNVNLAKRLEENGAPGMIHITQSVVDGAGKKYRFIVEKCMKSTDLRGVKGVPEGTHSYLIEVGQAGEESTILASKELPKIAEMQRAEHARWIQKEQETERRLAELQKRRQR